MKECLDKYMKQNVSFIIGDAYGADALAQKYLKDNNYEDVTIYTSTETPRYKNCSYYKFVSLWEKAQGKTGEDFYQVKDKAMCEACDIAVAFWNGNSYGVKCNLIRCLDMKKECYIFINEVKDDNITMFNEVLKYSINTDKAALPHFLIE